MKDVKKEFNQWKTGETCAVGKMEFDSLNLVKKRLEQGKYVHLSTIHQHVQFLDAITKKVTRISQESHKHQKLCPAAEKVLAQIKDVRAALMKEYKKLSKGKKPAPKRRRRYTGVGLRGIGAGSAKQAITRMR